MQRALRTETLSHRYERAIPPPSSYADETAQNILIVNKPPEGYWWVKLCDYGLAGRSEDASGYTTVRGTPEFMAPETMGTPFRGNPATADPFKVDIWCFGETIARALTGRRTFDSTTLLEYQNGRIDFPEGEFRCASVSPLGTSFIRGLMMADPSTRFSTPQAAQDAWITCDVRFDMSYRQHVHTYNAIDPCAREHLTQVSGHWTETIPLRTSISSDQATQASGQWTETMTQRESGSADQVSQSSGMRTSTIARPSSMCGSGDQAIGINSELIRCAEPPQGSSQSARGRPRSNVFLDPTPQTSRNTSEPQPIPIDGANEDSHNKASGSNLSRDNILVGVEQTYTTSAKVVMPLPESDTQRSPATAFILEDRNDSKSSPPPGIDMQHVVPARPTFDARSPQHSWAEFATAATASNEQTMIKLGTSRHVTAVHIDRRFTVNLFVPRDVEKAMNDTLTVNIARRSQLARKKKDKKKMGRKRKIKEKKRREKEEKEEKEKKRREKRIKEKKRKEKKKKRKKRKEKIRGRRERRRKERRERGREGRERSKGRGG